MPNIYHKHRDLNAMLNKVIERVAENIKTQSDLSKSIGRKKLPRIGRLSRQEFIANNIERDEEIDNENEN